MFTEACIVCLRANETNIIINNTYLQAVYEKIVDLKIDNVRGWMCFICHRRLQQCYQLWQLAEHTRPILMLAILGVQEDKIEEITQSRKSLLELSKSNPINISITSTVDAVEELRDIVKRELSNDGEVEARSDGIADRTARSSRDELSPQLSSSDEHDSLPVKVDQLPEDALILCEDIKEEFVQGNITVDSNEETAASFSSAAEDDEPATDIVNWQHLTSSEEMSRRPKVLKLELKKLNASDISKYKRRSSVADATCSDVRARDGVARACKYDPTADKQDGAAAEHLSISHTKIRYKHTCNLCQSRFSKKSCLKNHIKTHGDKPFTCDICQRRFKAKWSLRKHLGHHANENRFICDFCPRKFSDKTALKIHLKGHTGERPFTCDICNSTFTLKRRLDVHCKIHTGGKPFSCDICLHKFRLKGQLKKHISTHTGEKPFTCDICHSKFYYNSDLQRHLRVVHTGEKPFSCGICQDKFYQNWQLQAHLRVHTGDKPFRCDICLRVFLRRSSLQCHLKTHTDEKPYKCEICQRKFKTSITLERHVTTHTGEKPFKCDICERKFLRKGNLQTHIRLHVGDKPFSCTVCQQKFSQKIHLQNHSKKCVVS